MLAGAGQAVAKPPRPVPEDTALDQALQRLVAMPGGPPGAIAVVQRDRDLQVHTAGLAEVGRNRPPRATDGMHIASTAKAFSGGAALALVDQRKLGLDDTIGLRRPDLPRAWHGVTLRQLLNHTSGVPDFVDNPAAQQAIIASLLKAPPPRQLLDFVKDEPLKGQGTYKYSNSDNIIVGLIVETVTGRPYDRALDRLVERPLGLRDTSLPVGPEVRPRPFFHGYDLDEAGGPPEDVSEIVAGGWSWASGGIVSTPADLNRFIRGYVGGELFNRRIAAEQARFVEGGSSEPPGPGRNSAGLALFRYDTRCGTVFGHTGNTFGYTQFIAASRDGRRSVTVSINLQRTQKSTGQEAQVFNALRAVEEDGVCAALAR
ncbi:serine hydrolase domain-containing protein [Actinomycetospora atypica]|uniref:Serine hydrolase domain-containing protein n=1 Tax=Actinomycetospora atypica TaxID=1290095 RepID=A0ABV9YKV9_9PSEU